MITKGPIESKGSITLCAVGDIFLGGQLEALTTKFGPRHPFQHVQDILSKADITIGNLESPLTKRGDPLHYQPHVLRASPEMVIALEHAGFNIVSLANNHIMDYGTTGLRDTITYLKQHNIHYVGAGATLADARKPVILQNRNIKSGFLAYTLRGVSSAGKNRPGAAIINFRQMKDDINKIRNMVDIIVVSIHHGFEYLDYPNPSQRKIARELIELGATLVIGHHPHVVQGIERYGAALIAYSLGNFIFDFTILDYDTPKARQSLILKCTLDKTGVNETELIPVYINDDYQPQILQGKLADESLARLKQISSYLADNTIYPACFYRQTTDLTVGLNASVIGRLIRKHGIKAFLVRIPRIKPIYIWLLMKYVISKFKKVIPFQSWG